MLDFLFDDPIRHWVDINPGDIASNTVCLQDRCTTAHKKDRLNGNLKDRLLRKTLREAVCQEIQIEANHETKCLDALQTIYARQ